MLVIWKPTAWRARSALSRPEPGPLTSTSRVRTPWSAALRPASSAATCAAYGVDLRLPLKPIMPALDQAIALPCASVMVIMVLLKLALTCATPAVMFLRSLRRRRCGAWAIEISFLNPCHPGAGENCDCASLLLLARDRLGLALAGARIGVRALAADRQALAVPQPAVAGEVHQPLDVHCRFAAKVALDGEVLVDRLADVQHLLVGEVLDPLFRTDAELIGDLPGRGAADSVDVGQRDLDALVGGDAAP